MKRREPRSGARERPGAPQLTWAFTAMLAVMVAVALPAVLRLSAPVAPWRLPWPLLAAGFAAGRIVAIRFEFSGQAHVTTLSEVPLLIGLVFTSTDRLLVATLLGAVVGALWRRQTPVKTAFNITTRVVETVVAALCFHAVIGHAGALSATGWLAAFVALPAANLVSAICVQVAIALSVGRIKWTTLKTLAVVDAGAVILNVGVGRIAVALLWVDRATLVPFLAVASVLGLGYRAYSGLRRRHADLEQVYRFSRAVSGFVDADQVIQSVLSEARALARSGRAELALQGPGGETRYSLAGDGPLVVGVHPEVHPFQKLVDTAGGGVVASRTRSGGGLADSLMACGFRDAVAAPVFGDAGFAGVLVLSDRLNDCLSFDGADLKLVEALANHTTMALRSSRLVDQLRQQVAAKKHEALHDALTGLGNRTLFTEQLEAALAKRSGESVVAVMLMDLDRFKEVNDTLGHHTGDIMLQQIAAQLNQTVRDKGSVARLGGDEFAFVISGTSRAEVAETAQAILAGGQATVLVEGLRLEVRASLGVALVPDHGTDRSTLLRRADIAMYHAKTSRTGIAIYQPERDPYSTRRLVLASELRLALETSSLELHYQPKAEIVSGRVSGVEALLRWTHPVYGVISPEEFIPLAEQSGLMHPLTLWALESSLTQLAAWQREGFDLTLAANLSARSVFDADLAEELNRLLTETRVSPGTLTLEITESTIFGDRKQGHSVVDHLADLGVRVSIDDFGTGYSSLSRLAQLPVHELKIDRSFVTSMLTVPGHDAIVRSTIDLAQNLQLRVVAEGVEDQATWKRLGQLGCDAGQGYFLSPPLRASELATWLWHRQRQELAVIRPLRSVSR